MPRRRLTARDTRALVGKSPSSATILSPFLADLPILPIYGSPQQVAKMVPPRDRFAIVSRPFHSPNLLITYYVARPCSYVLLEFLPCLCYHVHRVRFIIVYRTIDNRIRCGIRLTDLSPVALFFTTRINRDACRLLRYSKI